MGLTLITCYIILTSRYQLDLKTMIEPSSSGAPVSLGARMRAAEALLRERTAEVVAAVVRHAEAGDRAAMRLARKHGLPVEPPPEVLAARLAESIERTRATVATLLAEGGLAVGKDSRLRPGPPCHVRDATKEAATLVNNNENTSGAEEGDAAG
jgi:hypothetical protein